jgi:hypothetical protein
MSGDPPRLLDESGGPDVLRLALAAARRDAPDVQALARLSARLPLGGPSDPPGGEGASDAPGDGAAAGDAAAGGGNVAAGGGNVAAGTAAAGRLPELAAASAAVSKATLSGLAIGAAVGGVILGGAWLLPPLPQPPFPAQAQRTVAVSAAPPARAAPAAPVPDDIARPAVEAPPAPVPPRGDASAPVAPRGLVDEATAPELAPSSSVPASAEPESALLRRAQGALASRPAEALALTEVHRARFPRGAFAQEREVIAISALSALGRRDEARARARRFVDDHPGSAYRRRIEVIVPELSIEAR